MSRETLAELPRPMAFVLPGGGALGAYQAGVLAALDGAGIAADLLVGVSAGAVTAALFAYHGLARLDNAWRGVRRRQLLRLHPGRMAMAVAGQRPSFVDNRHGRAYLDSHFGGRLVEDAPTRLAIVATDLSSGEAVALIDGDVTSALLASTAFPGVYPPIERDGRTLIDGGVVADIPLDLAVELGARSAVIVQVPPLCADRSPKRAIDILFRASTIGVEAHGRTVLRRPPPGLEVIEIPAPPTDVTTFALRRTGEVIDQGRSEAVAWLLRSPAPTAGGC